MKKEFQIPQINIILLVDNDEVIVCSGDTSGPEVTSISPEWDPLDE